MYHRNFPWNEVKIYIVLSHKNVSCVIPHHPLLDPSVVLKCLVQCTYNTINGEEKKGMMNASSRKVYFVYFAIFYESFKVTVNASCKFKDWSRTIEDDLIELMKKISWSDGRIHTDEFFEVFYSTHVLSEEFVISRWIFVESRSLKRLKFSLGYENRSDRSIKMTMMIVWLLFRVNRFITQSNEASIKLYREIISSKDNGFWKFVAIVKHWFVGSLINVF